VVGGQLLGQEGKGGEQEEAHDDEGEVFVHGPGITIAFMTAPMRG
jgi:hypothetical protein